MEEFSHKKSLIHDIEASFLWPRRDQLEVLGSGDAEEQGSDLVEGHRVPDSAAFLRRLEDRLRVWAHSGRREQLPQAELPTTAAIAAGLTGEGHC